MERKNNCIDISSDKMARLHRKRPEHGSETKTSREKLKLL